MHKAISGAGAGYFGDHTVVINRTNRVLVAKVNNVEWFLEPGENLVPAFLVPYAVRQNPRPGTLQMSTQYESLIAVPGITPEDECGMLAPGEDGQGVTDLIDRNAKPLVGEHTVERVTRSNLAERMLSADMVERTLTRTKVGTFDEK